MSKRYWIWRKLEYNMSKGSGRGSGVASSHLSPAPLRVGGKNG